MKCTILIFMQMHRHYIAPRVQIMQLRDRYTSEPLTAVQLKAALSALKLAGIDPTRLMDDAARFALDRLAKVI